MNKVISPIIFGESSPAVTDLQTALVGLGFVDINGDEQNRPLFGETTCRMVTAFKEKFRIKSYPCLVESQTAERINQRLIQFDQRQNPVKSPLVFGMRSDPVIDLQNALRIIGFGANIDPAENSTFGKTTCEAVVAFQREMGLQIVSCYVDVETADRINALIAELEQQPAQEERYRVSGFVYDVNNRRPDQQSVVAYDIDLLGSGIYKKATTSSALTAGGGVQLLGTAISNDDGFYSIEFTRAKFQTDESVESDTADVLVLAVDGEQITGRSLLSKKSNYRENQLENWDVTMFPATTRMSSSEYARVSGAVTKYLDSQTTRVQTWQIKENADMLEFLAEELSLSTDKVDAFVSAAALIHYATSPAGEVPVFASQFPTVNELLYGIARQSIKLEWPLLSKGSVASIRNYIMESAEANIISVHDVAAVGTFSQELYTFASQRMLMQSPLLKAALSIAIDREELIAKFHERYSNRVGTHKDFWEQISTDDDLKDKVPMLKLTNQLAALTGNHAPVMTRLATMAQGSDAVTLLELSDESWKTAIGTDLPAFVTGANDDEKSVRYRDYMRNKLYAAFYNKKVSLMAKKEDEIKIHDQDIRDMLSQFLTSTKFDLRSSRLHDNIGDTALTFQMRLDEIAGSQNVEVGDALNKVQRVFQFSPSPEVMTRLLEAGIDSATMVASMPFSTFKVRYQSIGDEQTLMAIYQRARHIVSMIEYSILSLNRFSQSARVSAIGGIDIKEQN